MTAEDEQKPGSRPTLGGLTCFAEFEIHMIERAEKERHEGYRLKSALAVNQLDRIIKLAHDSEIELPKDLVAKMDDLIITHPDRDETIKTEIKSYL